MGSAGSVANNSPKGPSIPELDPVPENISVRNADNSGRSVKNQTFRRNVKRIFERQETDDDMDISSLLVDEPKDEDTRNLLVNALSGFFFLQANAASEVNPKMELLMRGMRREEFEEGYLLITEGESGTKLFVVAEGTLEVTINGTVIREMQRGSMLGELALLYDAPRSATVQCKSHCVLWSLSREIFKKIQAVAATANQVQRARWLIQSPELATLSAIDQSRLVGTLHAVHFNAGDKVISEGELTTHIMLVEKGHAMVSSTTGKSGATRRDIDQQFGILRPREGKRRSVEYMNATELKGYLDNKNDIVIDGTEGTDGEAAVNSNHLCEVYEGCMVGLPTLKAKANLPGGWQWVTENGKSGARAPFTITAMSTLHCLVFTVEVFENLFGPAEKAIMSQKSPVDLFVESEEETKAPEKPTQRNFDSTKFKMKCILGSGSFGVVTLAEYRSDKNQNQEVYALKSLSKSTVTETHQLRHVLDERKLLACLDSPFILKLYGTYQTAHQLVMVTEPLTCGDLWSVIYETPQYNERGGLPVSLTRFYATNLVYGLSHIHEKGIVFRDLKPENIMLDSRGYLRIIDFGFSKRVPYTKKDANGVLQVHAKTYTLCGTPEYLSPELIFNMGHNHASDIWALGVIVYEMLMSVTPFAPKRPDNVTELFTNIAMVKKNGVNLSARIDQHSGTPLARVFISTLLKADPAERLGVAEGSTRCILDHSFFDGIDKEGIYTQTFKPEFIPPSQRDYESIANLPPVKPFNGDQTLFAEF